MGIVHHDGKITGNGKYLFLHFFLFLFTMRNEIKYILPCHIFPIQTIMIAEGPVGIGYCSLTIIGIDEVTLIIDYLPVSPVIPFLHLFTVIP